MRRPVNSPYTITTTFGVPDSYARFGRHSGIDYAIPLNRPIYAPASGKLTNVVSSTGGNMVVIFDGKYYHRLMHNNSFSRPEGAVSEGQEVAKAGTTGLSTGVHCHHDINTEGVYPTSFSAFVNPETLLNQEDIMTPGEIDVKYQLAMNRRATATEIARHTGRPHAALDKEILASAENRALRTRASNYPKVEAALKTCQSEAKLLTPGKYLVQ